MFDAHTHLHDARLAPQLDTLLAEAAAAGVTDFAVCGTSPADWPLVAALAIARPSVHPAFGVHPWYVDGLPADWLEQLAELLLRHPGAAVGEVGLDALRQSPDPATQRRVLEAQLALAARLGRPVALHAVRCVPEVLDALRPYATRLPGFLVHSYAGSVASLRELEKLGGYASFGGTLLNPNAKRVHAAATAVSPDRLLAETDAPDMLPPGGRGVPGADRLNHPANLVAIVAALARRRGRDAVLVAEETSRNARRLLCAGNSVKPRGWSARWRQEQSGAPVSRDLGLTNPS